MARSALRLGVLASHPIQYQAPIFRALAARCDLQVFFAHRQSPQAQAEAGFGVAFDWDVDLLAGYAHEFLPNLSAHPGTDRFGGCDTPSVSARIAAGSFDAFLVLGWNLRCYWQAVRACRAHGVPVMVRGDSQLVTQRSLLKRWAKRLAYPPLLRRFSAGLYVGERNRAYLLHYGMPAERLFFAPHSIDVDAFGRAAAAADTPAIRARWGIQAGEAAVMFAGKLVARKRPADLVAAASLLRQQGRAIRLVWAGDGPEGEHLRTLSAAASVPSTFLGFQNQSALPSLYRAADLLALPSDGSETWGLVVNEALACATRCVVSDACGCAPDLVRPGTGATYPVGDVPALAGALARVLDDPVDRSALARVSAAYSPSATAEGITQAARAVATRTGMKRGHTA